LPPTPPTTTMSPFALPWPLRVIVIGLAAPVHDVTFLVHVSSVVIMSSSFDMIVSPEKSISLFRKA
jgi:hypothetical protein